MGTHRNLRDKLKSCQIFISHKSITYEYLVLNKNHENTRGAKMENTVELTLHQNHPQASDITIS